MAVGWFNTDEAGNPVLSPEEITAKRKLAAELMKSAGDYSPVQHWTQGLARVLGGAAGGYEDAQLDKAAKANNAYEAGVLSKIFGGSDTPAATTSAPVPDPNSPGAWSKPYGGTAPDDIKGAIATAAAKYNVDPEALTKVAGIESSFNPNAKNPNSSAAGLFQFTSGTAKDYGLANPYDVNASADAAARLMADNRATLAKALGRDPTPGELYLAHQQGAGGASKLLANPDAPAGSLVGNRAVALNGGDPNMPASAFAAKWTGKVDGSPAQQAIAAATSQPQAPQAAPVQLAGATPAAAPAATAPMPAPQPSNNNRAALIAALSDPRISEKGRGLLMALMQQQMDNKATYQTDGEGNIIQLDPRGVRPPQVVYRAAVKPTILPDGASAVLPDGQGGFKVAASGGNKISGDVATREQEAKRLGLDPNDARTKQYVLTGSYPKEPELTSTDKNAIIEADEMVSTNKATISALQKAKELSPQAWGVIGAGPASKVLSPFSDGAQKTVEMNQIITENALASLKSIFGGNPTEGERKILLDIQGAASQPDNIRQGIFDRAIAAAQRRLEFNENRAKQLRGGTYYKPGNSPVPDAKADPLGIR